MKTGLEVQHFQWLSQCLAESFLRCLCDTELRVQEEFSQLRSPGALEEALFCGTRGLGSAVTASFFLVPDAVLGSGFRLEHCW